MFHNISSQANIHLILVGLCNGAISEHIAISFKFFLSIIVAVENFSHQYTILCQIALISFILFITAFFHIIKTHKASLIASSWFLISFLSSIFSSHFSYCIILHLSHILSIIHLAKLIFFGISKISYFNEELHEFITNIFIFIIVILNIYSFNLNESNIISAHFKN
jgi:hypothetical protein